MVFFTRTRTRKILNYVFLKKTEILIEKRLENYNKNKCNANKMILTICYIIILIFSKHENLLNLLKEFYHWS